MTPYDAACARAGRITSSRVAVIATGDYKAWNSLAEQLRKREIHTIGQRSGVPPLDWGHKYEPMAAGEFWFRHPEMNIEHELFCYWHDPKDVVHWQTCGASPDRTIWRGDQRVGVVEIKCPYKPSIHREYWGTGVLPYWYEPQFYWQLIVTDAPEGWFVSFDPREPDDLAYFELRMPRNQSYEQELMGKVDRFIGGLLAGETFKKPKHDYTEMF